MSAGSSSPRAVNGVLLLDKPVGITSNAAIQRVKRLLHAAKAGHVGTLDPLASGLLPVCLGEATKFATGTFGADKSYDAEILLGVTTTTGDTEGEITTRHIVDVTTPRIEEVLRCFTGSITQTPPMYSALKRAGKPLYTYARAGQTVPRAPRDITIHELVLKGYFADRLQVSVRCTKGTYIRVLAEDIGRVLGCGATLAGLRRIAVGGFGLAQAVALERLEAFDAARRTASVLPVDTLVAELPALELDAGQQQRVLSGRATPHSGVETTGLVRLYDRERHFLGLAEITSGLLMPKRLVAASAIGPVEAGDELLQAPKIP